MGINIQSIIISKNIHLLIHKAPDVGSVEPGKRLIYSIVLFGNTLSLINTGPSGSEKLIFDYIRSQKRMPGEIETMLLTSADPNQCGAAMAIKENTDCMVIAHYKNSHFIEKNATGRGSNSEINSSQAFKINYLLDGSEQFNFGDELDMELVYNSGETGSELSVLFPKQEIIFSNVCLSRINREIVANATDRKQVGRTLYISAYNEPLLVNHPILAMKSGLLSKIPDNATIGKPPMVNMSKKIIKRAG